MMMVRAHAGTGSPAPRPEESGVDVMRAEDRPEWVERLEGALKEVRLAHAPDGWELVLGEAKGGTDVLPIPFRHEELGLVLEGRVRMTVLPEDYDPATVQAEASEVVLAPGDAFRIASGDRVMMEVLDDLRFLFARPRLEEQSRPRGCCG